MSSEKRFRLRCELLEDRCMPADFTVNTHMDTPDVAGDNKAEDAQGNVSLRAVIEFTNDPNRIRVGNWNNSKYVVDFAVSGIPITLGTVLPELKSNFHFIGGGVTIRRDSANQFQFRLLDVISGTESRIYEVTFSGGYSGSIGGAIRNRGKLHVENCNFHDNQAFSQGGAISSDDAATQLTIVSCSLWSNTSKTGGAVFSAQSTVLLISDSDIFSNSATGNNRALFEGMGGGVFISTDIPGATAQIKDGSRIYGNSATRDGGGVYVLDTDLTMTGGEIHSNYASGWGGGIYINAAGKDITLEQLKLTSNGALVKGGGAYILKGNLTLLNLVSFTGNTALGIPGCGYKQNQATAVLTNPPANPQDLEEDS